MQPAISKTVADLAERMRKTLRAFTGSRLTSLFLSVAPVPASRPRVTKFGGVYYGAPYKRFYEAAQEKLKAEPGHLAVVGPCVWAAEFVIEKPRTGKLEFPRGDVDNYCKGPMDAMTKAAEKFWTDDNQVVGVVAFKRYAQPGEEPGVKIDYVSLESA